MLLLYLKTFQFLNTQMAAKLYKIKSHHASVNTWILFYRKSVALHLKTTAHPLETRLLIIKFCRFQALMDE